MARDFTRIQFRAAAARNGFEIGPFGLVSRDVPDCHSHSFGYIYQQKPFRLMRRVSLAHAIEARILAIEIAKRKMAERARRVENL